MKAYKTLAEKMNWNLPLYENPGDTHQLFGLGFTWWGWNYWFLWRWNGTHIDLGPLTIRGIKRPWLWLPLAWLIKPLRIWYHWWYVGERFREPEL